ncbi:hypothetical protein FNF27_05687 [Cafeteria roenbergensis]|uniref:Hsp70-Hsp90 organising protein n=2 Tax=Cafeteria roenbergensis TaxID=33653 RepID=A0A5A8E0L3_CAFRO|nr:hypothetical protein FNF29_01645 [Cafeteria roenbergensis]KAA0171305.1 hypothetical protein FNF28_00796 [Cafeteria roenbergensis]KAA0172826.1 hypothetical protein FNF27_05687 [Cafeteria roenbergensis]|eukprot:KAA0155730.1 hypothetical protein FNF29_01645 [Cafeteria roenbergensis]
MAASNAEAEAFKAQGNAALSAQKFDEAADLYTKAIELDPSNHVYFSNRSAAYLSAGNGAKALEDAEACIAANPTWAKGFSRKGAALHKLQRLPEAVAAFEQGLTIDPSNAALKSGLEDVKRAMAANPFSDIVAWCSTQPRFAAHMSDPAFVSRLKLLSGGPQMLSTIGDDPRIMEVIGARLGIDLSGAGGPPGGAAGPGPSDGKTAAEREAEAKAKKEAEERAAEEAARAEAEAGMTEEERAELEAERKAKAEAEAKKAEADKAKDEGNTFYKARKFDEAVACYDRAIAMVPEEVTYKLNKAAAIFEAGDSDGCVALCEEVVETARGQRPIPWAKIAKAFARMAAVKQRAGDIAGAIDLYEKAQAESASAPIDRRIKQLRKQLAEKEALDYLDAEKGKEAKERGNEAFKSCNFTDAIDHYSEAIRRDPENPIYWTNRATAKCKVMDFGGALDDSVKAIKIDPSYAKAYARKARIEMFSKLFHKALDTVMEGLSKDEDNVELRQVNTELQAKIQAAMYAPPDPERQERAMQDPEIAGIMRDPMTQQALRDLGTDPSAMSRIMSDPGMSLKLNRLILAGVVSFGGPGAARGGDDE